MIYSIIRVWGFPVLFFGTALIFHHFHFHALAFYGIIGASLLLAAVLERLLPYERSWNQTRQDTLIDVLHFLLTTAVTTATKTLSVLAVGWLAGAFPVQHTLATVVQQVPFVFSVALAAVVSGFLPYWVHRFSHEKDGLLWRLHSVHHSPERLYWLNATRFHPFNAVWNAFLSLFPLHLLGFSEPVLLMTGLLNNLVGLYNHANIDFRLGWMNRLFNMNELHRWHHAKDVETANHNYSAGCLVVWDLVFGTWHLPERRMQENEVGLADAEGYPTRSFTGQLCYPVCSLNPPQAKP